MKIYLSKLEDWISGVGTKIIPPYGKVTPCGTNAWETHRIGDPSSFLVIDGHEVFAAHFLCSIAKHKFST